MVIKKIRAGIVGGSMNNKWASQTHIPALLKHSNLDITAVGTSRMESARQSAEEVGAALAFDDAKKLAASEDVDMVVVSVKVPHHYEAVMAAIQERKHIFVNGPWGQTLRKLLKWSRRRHWQAFIIPSACRHGRILKCKR